VVVVVKGQPRFVSSQPVHSRVNQPQAGWLVRGTHLSLHEHNQTHTGSTASPRMPDTLQFLGATLLCTVRRWHAHAEARAMAEGGHSSKRGRANILLINNSSHNNTQINIPESGGGWSTLIKINNTGSVSRISARPTQPHYIQPATNTNATLPL
jgi:hypothetical protein